MLDAGIVLLIFGIISVIIGKSLDGSNSDLFALAGMAPRMIGYVLILLGTVSCIFGISLH